MPTESIPSYWRASSFTDFNRWWWDLTHNSRKRTQSWLWTVNLIRLCGVRLIRATTHESSGNLAQKSLETEVDGKNDFNIWIQKLMLSSYKSSELPLKQLNTLIKCMTCYTGQHCFIYSLTSVWKHLKEWKDMLSIFLKRSDGELKKITDALVHSRLTSVIIPWISALTFVLCLTENTLYLQIIMSK